MHLGVYLNVILSVHLHQNESVDVQMWIWIWMPINAHGAQHQSAELHGNDDTAVMNFPPNLRLPPESERMKTSICARGGRWDKQARGQSGESTCCHR